MYVGEYAAHDEGRRTTLRSALAEAAYLTSLERNADVVPFASYAPMLAKRGRVDWSPDMIYFSNTEIVRTINYYVQQLFSVNSGDVCLPTTVTEPASASADKEGKGDGVFLGTWDTQAEFDNVRVSSGAQVIFEDRSDASAQNWQPDGGKWALTDGIYRQSGSDQPAVSRLTASTGGTHYTLTLRARKTGGTEGFLIGFRAQDAANFYWWNLGGWGNTLEAIEQSVNGAKRTVGERTELKIEPNRWYDIRVEVTGTRIKCYLNGQLKHDFEDRGFETSPNFAVSSVRDSKSGDLILKIVNGAGVAKPLQIKLAEAGKLAPKATLTTLSGDPLAVNDFGHPNTLTPQVSTIKVGPLFEYKALPNSLNVLRIPSR